MVGISIFCQYNPLSSSTAGGIGALIRSFISNSPEDFDFEVVGVSDDLENFPVGQYHWIAIRDREVKFLPIMHEDDKTKFLPLGIRFTQRLNRYPHMKLENRILHFHRPEPLIPLLKVSNHKILFIHNSVGESFGGQSLQVRLRNTIYKKINRLAEDTAVPAATRVYTVRENFATEFRQRYQQTASNIHCIPTWADTSLFKPAEPEMRRSRRAEIDSAYGWSEEDLHLIFVGRLEEQKDPTLLIDTFSCLQAKRSDARLLLIGDGSLREGIKKRICDLNLSSSVKMLGNLEQSEIARLLSAMDVFLLPSRYEGMPVALLESLASGVPVVAADVGDVYRTLRKGGGILVNDRKPETFADAVLQLQNSKISQSACQLAVQPFSASAVLSGLYESHYLMSKVQR